MTEEGIDANSVVKESTYFSLNVMKAYTLFNSLMSLGQTSTKQGESSLFRKEQISNAGRVWTFIQQALSKSQVQCANNWTTVL